MNERYKASIDSHEAVKKCRMAVKSQDIAKTHTHVVFPSTYIHTCEEVLYLTTRMSRHFGIEDESFTRLFDPLNALYFGE